MFIYMRKGLDQMKFAFLSSLFLAAAFSPLYGEEWLLLHYNENSRPPFASVRKAMEEALADSGRYPDGDHAALVEQIAAYHSVGKDRVLLANGLTCILKLVAEVFTGAGREMIVPFPGYEFFNVFAERRDGKVIRVPLRADYAHDLDRALQEVTSATTLVYICNPNNPTGSVTPREEIVRFIAQLPSHVSIFIDEAYHHFGQQEKGYVSFLDQPIEDERVIVGRTFSKAYSFAGMRLGYVVASPAMIRRLERYNCINHNNVAALRGGMAALRDEEGLKEVVEANRLAREEFYRQLAKRGFGWVDSHANFVMMETGDYSVEELIAHFEKHKIRIGRKFLNGYVRISMGLPEEMARFWQVWDLLKE